MINLFMALFPYSLEDWRGENLLSHTRVFLGWRQYGGVFIFHYCLPITEHTTTKDAVDTSM